MRVLMRKHTFIGIALLLWLTHGHGQGSKQYRMHTVAFYNLENLFDTINDPMKNDELSPIMELQSNRKAVYLQKLRNMASVIANIGKDLNQNSPSILGVAEIENREVLEDLVNDSLLIAKDYGIIHYDSPDSRGIDVGLIYQKDYFRPVYSRTYTLRIYDDDNRRRISTRDQLLVSGFLEGDLVFVIVNHWPSRRGGEARSRPKRVAAAKLNKRIVDSIQALEPYAKIILMGDFNDNPNNTSFKEVLSTKSDRDEVGFQGLYNPFEKMYKAGFGTTGYRDAWSLFDQIILSKPLLEASHNSYFYFKAGIYNKNYLTTPKGRYKGYPYRSFSNGNFTGGYSDHYPVYVYLIKELKE